MSLCLAGAAAHCPVWVHVLLQLESVLVFLANVTTEGHKNQACWNLRAVLNQPAPCWPWDSWPCPSLDIATGKLDLALRRDGLTHYHRCERIDQWHGSKRVGSASLRGRDPSVLEWRPQLSPDHHSRPIHDLMKPVRNWFCGTINAESLWLGATMEYTKEVLVRVQRWWCARDLELDQRHNAMNKNILWVQLIGQKCI